MKKEVNKRKLKNGIKSIIELLIIPLTLISIYLSMFLLWKIFQLPAPEELIFLITEYFNKYGLWIVFASALIEGFLLLGEYFPGGLIIFLGVISAGKDYVRATEVVILVSIAFFIAYLGDYFLGKYGFHTLFMKFGLKRSVKNAQKKLLKHGFKTIIFSYWGPSLSSITATAAGILKLSVKKFIIYSAIGIIIWETFWGVLVFNLGNKALKLVGIKYIVIMLVVYISIILISHYIHKKFFSKKLKNLFI